MQAYKRGADEQGHAGTGTSLARLRPAWSFSTSTDKGEEAAPIVADGTLFVVTDFPNRVLAFGV